MPFYLGNIIVANTSNIINLYTEVANGVLMSDLMTLSTDQIIKTNVFISEILTTDVSARIINDLIRFVDKVVLLGQDNVIKSERGNI